MSSNPFKSFIPYYVPLAFVTAAQDHYADHPDAATPWRATDPEAGAWRKIGLTPTPVGDYFHTLDGIGVLFCVQFNERILPGAVRDEHLARRIAEITERQGYKPGRKEFAQIKDEVTFELLPKAFIKRSVVPVLLLRPHWLLVCTSSAKRADDVMAFLHNMYSGTDNWRPAFAVPMKSPIDSLNSIARTTPGRYDVFEAASAAVLKGENKRTIRIKDRDIYGDEVQELLTNDTYDVHELGLTYYPKGRDDEGNIRLTVTDKMVFKGLTLSDARLAKEDGEQDFHSYAWVVGEEYRVLASTLFDSMGGLRLPEPSTTPAAPATDDDEL